MKIRTTILTGLACILMLGACAKTATTAQISDTMMNGLARAQQTTSYTIKKTYKEEPANEEWKMCWKDEDRIYIVHDFGQFRRMELIRSEEKTFDDIFGLVGINVFEVQSVEKSGRYYGYLSGLDHEMRFPMKLDDKGRCVGLKPEFQWSMNGDTIHAMLKDSERAGYNARFLEEAKRELSGLKDLNMKDCEYTFHFDPEGNLIAIDEKYEIDWIYEDHIRIDKQDNVSRISYDDVSEKLRSNVYKAFEQEAKVGDNIEWDPQGIPRAEQKEVVF